MSEFSTISRSKFRYNLPKYAINWSIVTIYNEMKCIKSNLIHIDHIEYIHHYHDYYLILLLFYHIILAHTLSHFLVSSPMKWNWYALFSLILHPNLNKYWFFYGISIKKAHVSLIVVILTLFYMIFAQNLSILLSF